MGDGDDPELLMSHFLSMAEVTRPESDMSERALCVALILRNIEGSRDTRDVTVLSDRSARALFTIGSGYNPAPKTLKSTEAVIINAEHRWIVVPCSNKLLKEAPTGQRKYKIVTDEQMSIAKALTARRVEARKENTHQGLLVVDKHEKVAYWVDSAVQVVKKKNTNRWKIKHMYTAGYCAGKVLRGIETVLVTQLKDYKTGGFKASTLKHTPQHRLHNDQPRDEDPSAAFVYAFLDHVYRSTEALINLKRAFPADSRNNTRFHSLEVRKNMQERVRHQADIGNLQWPFMLHADVGRELGLTPALFFRKIKRFNFSKKGGNGGDKAEKRKRQDDGLPPRRDPNRNCLETPPGTNLPNDFADSTEVNGNQLKSWKRTNAEQLRRVIPAGSHKATDLSYRAALQSLSGQRFVKESRRRLRDIWSHDPHSGVKDQNYKPEEIRTLMRITYEADDVDKEPARDNSDDDSDSQSRGDGDNDPQVGAAPEPKPKPGSTDSGKKPGPTNSGTKPGPTGSSKTHGNDGKGAPNKATHEPPKSSKKMAPRSRQLKYPPKCGPKTHIKFASTTTWKKWAAVNHDLFDGTVYAEIDERTQRAVLHRTYTGSFKKESTPFLQKTWYSDPHAFFPEEQAAQWSPEQIATRMDLVYVDPGFPDFFTLTNEEVEAWMQNLPDGIRNGLMKDKDGNVLHESARGLLHRIFVGDFSELWPGTDGDINAQDSAMLEVWRRKYGPSPKNHGTSSKNESLTEEDAIRLLEISYDHQDVPFLRPSPLHWPPLDYLVQKDAENGSQEKSHPATSGTQSKSKPEANKGAKGESNQKRPLGSAADEEPPRKKLKDSGKLPRGFKVPPKFYMLRDETLIQFMTLNPGLLTEADEQGDADSRRWASRARLRLLFNGSFENETDDNLLKHWSRDVNISSGLWKNSSPEVIRAAIKNRYEA